MTTTNENYATNMAAIDKTYHVSQNEIQLIEALRNFEYLFPVVCVAPNVLIKEADPRVNALLHGALGLAGEAGEVANLVKKVVFKYKANTSPFQIADELGDVFWYFMRTLKANGISLSEIVDRNNAKLAVRHGGVDVKARDEGEKLVVDVKLKEEPVRADFDDRYRLIEPEVIEPKKDADRLLQSALEELRQYRETYKHSPERPVARVRLSRDVATGRHAVESR